jgi:hypothetical protein
MQVVRIQHGVAASVHVYFAASNLWVSLGRSAQYGSEFEAGRWWRRRRVSDWDADKAEHWPVGDVG